MKRVPVELVITMLRRSGIQATARQIRKWTYRGHITHTPEGYDLAEVAAYVRQRADLRVLLERRSEGVERLRRAELCPPAVRHGAVGRRHSIRG